MSQSNISVETAFETLRTALDRALETAWQSVDEAARSKKPDGAQQALDRVRSLDQLLQQLAAFRSEFENCTNIAAEPDVPANLLASSNYTVRHVRRSRSSDLNVTSRNEYYRPILETLVEFSGRARVVAVLDRIGEKMQHRFTEDDRALLPEGGSIRWRNHAQWARLDMVKEGLLRHGSPTGIWEITAEGRAWLERRYS